MKVYPIRNEPQVGEAVTGWSVPAAPEPEMLIGSSCRVEPLKSLQHGQELYESYSEDKLGLDWTYLPYGPFPTLDEFQQWIDKVATGLDPMLFAIIDVKSGRAVGIAAYLRINPADGTIEVGHLVFSNALKGTTVASEAMYLMMANVFKLGYRRYEWKCNALNRPSRFAAQRLGFSFEGVWRQAKIVKGRNRDTAWFAIIDKDWPLLDSAFLCWLDPVNFDKMGLQITSLRSLTEPLLFAKDPSIG